MPFVCKEDGGIQCHPEIKPQTLEEARDLLVSLIGKSNVIGNGHSHQRNVIALCGHVTGGYHHFEITEQGKYILERGTLGPQGFLACEGDKDETASERASDNAEEINLGQVLQECELTSAGSTPVLIRELIGRRVRDYNYGDPITKDLRPDRVNIERDKAGVFIRRIWFG